MHYLEDANGKKTQCCTLIQMNIKFYYYSFFVGENMNLEYAMKKAFENN